MARTNAAFGVGTRFLPALTTVDLMYVVACVVVLSAVSRSVALMPDSRGPMAGFAREVAALVVAPSAQAYSNSNLRITWIEQDADTCETTRESWTNKNWGYFETYDWDLDIGLCEIVAFLDDGDSYHLNFEVDQGGRNLWVLVEDSSGKDLAWFIFEAYDEYFRNYDLSDDGDTLYAYVNHANQWYDACPSYFPLK